MNEGERLTRLEENQKYTNAKLDSLESKFDEFIKSADQKYSAKWVEKGIAIIITAIVLGAIYAIFNHVGVPVR